MSGQTTVDPEILSGLRPRMMSVAYRMLGSVTDAEDADPAVADRAIAETKHLVNVASLPSDADIAPEWDAFLASVQRPAAQLRIKKLMELGFHKPGDVENRLGYHVGQLGT